MSHIQLNYAFMLFWSIFGLIHWKVLFFVKKNDYIRKEHKNNQNVCFSYKFEKGKILRKFDLFKQLFWINPVKGDKY